jgi:hypothetical protein
MSTGHLLVLLSVVLAAVVIAVLAVSLTLVMRGLRSASTGLATLADALEGVESSHLRPLKASVEAINAQFDAVLSVIPGIASKAAIVANNRVSSAADLSPRRVK